MHFFQCVQWNVQKTVTSKSCTTPRRVSRRQLQWTQTPWTPTRLTLAEFTWPATTPWTDPSLRPRTLCRYPSPPQTRNFRNPSSRSPQLSQVRLIATLSYNKMLLKIVLYICIKTHACQKILNFFFMDIPKFLVKMLLVKIREFEPSKIVNLVKTWGF